MWHTLSILTAAYLLGTLPWSYLVARLAGYQIRQLGDGNVGAHNVMRHVGRGWGLLALLLDSAKGALAVLLARSVAGPAWLAAVAALLAVAGHNYPLWLRFRGGKGLAASLGAGLALLPELAWLTLAGGLLLILLTRNLAFSGLAVGLLLVPGAWLAGYPAAEVLAPLGLLGLMGLRQWPDLQRAWRQEPDKRRLILERWIRDRNARL